MAKTTAKEFIRQVKQEMGRVTWPSRKEAMLSTAIVIVVVMITSLFFLLVDMVAYQAVQLILRLGV